MRKIIALILASVTLGTVVTYAVAEAGVWQRTPNGDGSVTFRSGLVLPKRASDIRVTYNIATAKTGQKQVAITVVYCQKKSICDLAKR